MKTKLRMKCKNWGNWNRIEVEKVFLNPEPKVQVFLPSYIPLKTEKCSKCNHVIAEEKELIRIIKR